MPAEPVARSFPMALPRFLEARPRPAPSFSGLTCQVSRPSTMPGFFEYAGADAILDWRAGAITVPWPEMGDQLLDLDSATGEAAGSPSSLTECFLLQNTLAPQTESCRFVFVGRPDGKR